MKDKMIDEIKIKFLGNNGKNGKKIEIGWFDNNVVDWNRPSQLACSVDEAKQKIAEWYYQEFLNYKKEILFNREIEEEENYDF
mgnify:CR=1 FL=1